VSQGQGKQRSASGQATEKVLFLLVDAVPIRTAREVVEGADGSFAGFQGPVPLVSSFPSSTNVVMPGIFRPLGVATSPGYEARYFDRGRGRMRGGGPWSYYRGRFAWRRMIDWQAPEPLGTTAGLLGAGRLLLPRLRAAVERFVASPARRFFVYLGFTDLDAHYRPHTLAGTLGEIGEMLADLRRRSAFSTVLYSDHGIAGGAPLANLWAPVREALRQAGFRPSQRLRRSADVALSHWGLVSNFEAFTGAGEEPAVAAVLAAVPGVDLCAFAEGDDRWRVVSSRGSATFSRSSRDGAERWAYRPADGDPLGYAAVAGRLAERCSAAANDFFADQLWFEESLEADYPDALYRLARAFELVDNPASIVCSLAPGRMFGAPRTEWAARLVNGPIEWTHGSLARQASLGFLMTDVEGWRPPPAARFDRALAPLLGGDGP